jgi:putative hydrolase of the HAD superfamily
LSIENPECLDGKKDELVQLAYRGRITQEQFREKVLQLYGITDPINKEIGKKILDEEDNGVQFFDGVKETLLALKSNGFYLGIITDTANSVSAKISWFEKGGFGHIWDSIISSRELGIRKPDPEIYQAALNQLNINGGQALFVGHKEIEINGAHAVGVKTIAFNYDTGVKSEFFIDHFSDLLEIPLIKCQIKKLVQTN